MVNCAAYGCNVESGTHRMSMFKFPKELKRRKLWIQRLNRGRTVTTDFVPSVHSKLCLKHFEDSQFLISPKFAKEVGYKNFRLRLKPDAVPTLFETPGRKEIGHKPKDRHSAMTISKKKIKHEVSNSFNCFS